MTYKRLFKYYNFINNAKNKCNSYDIHVNLANFKRDLSQQTHNLPKLPVPKLESSVAKYLTAVRPLLNDAEFDQTKKIVADFSKKGGLGQKLQDLLIDKANRTDNWLYQWWLDKAYLEPRYSVMINVNPATLYPRANYTTLDDKLIFATSYIAGFFEFKKYLEDKKLVTEKLGGAELDMIQYYQLFGTCRIPKRNKDEINVFHLNQLNYKKTNHIIIMFNDRIFSLPIVDKNSGLPLSLQTIHRNLKNMIESTKNEKGIGLGLLTAEDRDIWADSYSILIQNEQNRKFFEEIHNSFFVLCLDHDQSQKYCKLDERSFAAGQLLHGNKQFTSNRFFDKTIQVIIGENGIWGVNFEHSIAEALPHNLMNDFIYHFINSNENKIANHLSSLAKTDKNINYKELSFNIPNEVNNQINKSKQSVYKMIDNLELYILNFDLFGKNFPKSQKISPDAFVQIAMQLAFYRLHNKLGNTYESGSLRKFNLGRTDIIRTCSSDVVEFLKSTENLCDGGVNSGRLMLKAINSHRLYTNQVVNCESFDRHFLGLKLISIENNIELSDFYKDIAFQRMGVYHISSSQVSSKHAAVTSYGPATEDGYGACYNIMEDRIMFGISAFNSSNQTSAKSFGNAIKNALIDSKRFLVSINQ